MQAWRIALAAALVLEIPGAHLLAYDPLAETPAPTAKPLDLTVTDPARQRDIPIRVYLPAGKKPAPVVLFSHGLGGSREGSVFSPSSGHRTVMWPSSCSIRAATLRSGKARVRSRRSPR